MLVLILFIGLLTILLWRWFSALKSFPPGPIVPLPILRKLPWSEFYGKTDLDIILALEDRYDGVYNVHLGNKRVVIMSDFDKVQNIFAKKINRRPVDDLVSYVRKMNYGIIFTNGIEWRDQRKTFVQLMKKTGFNTKNVESAVEHIWPKLRKSLTMEPSMTVKMFEPMETDKIPSLDRMEQVLMEFLVLAFADRSVFPNNEIPIEYLDQFNTFRTCGIQWMEKSLWYKIPILRHLAPEFSGFTWISNMMKDTTKTLNHIVNLHKNNNNRKTDSYIDAYLELIENKDDSESEISAHEALIASMDNVLLGGDGIFFGFFSLLYCLSKFPDVQEKMRDEINALNEEEKKDKKHHLPYCWAVIMETLRYFPIAGFGGPHHSDKDIIVDNYKIPAWTDVFPDLVGIMRNSRYWENPHDFKPQRFLNGQTNKHWIPFQIGGRTCPGKSFALDFLFTVSVKIVNELKLTFDGFEDTSLENPSALEEMNYIGMILVHHHPFNVKVETICDKVVSEAQKFRRMHSFGG